MAIWCNLGVVPLLTIIPVRSQWGHSEIIQTYLSMYPSHHPSISLRHRPRCETSLELFQQDEFLKPSHFFNTKLSWAMKQEKAKAQKA